LPGSTSFTNLECTSFSNLPTLAIESFNSLSAILFLTTQIRLFVEISSVDALRGTMTQFLNILAQEDTSLLIGLLSISNFPCMYPETFCGALESESKVCNRL
jgi:hypothetical protein